MDVAPEHRAGTQVREGADADAVLDVAVVHHDGEAQVDLVGQAHVVR